MKIIERLKAKETAPISCRVVSIAFLGDSVTQGCFECETDENGIFTNTVNDYKACYTEQVRLIFADLFPDVPVSVINAGLSGTAAYQGLERLERDVLSFSPDLLVVMFGLNDCHQDRGSRAYAADLGRIFDAAKNAGTEVVFITPNMMCTYRSPLVRGAQLSDISDKLIKAQNDGTFEEYIEAAKEMCRSMNVRVCDYYKLWKEMAHAGADTTALLANGINHPDRRMHRVLAELLVKTIMEE